MLSGKYFSQKVSNQFHFVLVIGDEYCLVLSGKDFSQKVSNQFHFVHFVQRTMGNVVPSSHEAIASIHMLYKMDLLY